MNGSQFRMLSLYGWTGRCVGPALLLFTLFAALNGNIRYEPAFLFGLIAGPLVGLGGEIILAWVSLKRNA